MNLGLIAMISVTASDCSGSYPGHSLSGWSYPSAEMQSLYSTASADWAFVCEYKVQCRQFPNFKAKAKAKTKSPQTYWNALKSNPSTNLIFLPCWLNVAESPIHLTLYRNWSKLIDYSHCMDLPRVWNICVFVIGATGEMSSSCKSPILKR